MQKLECIQGMLVDSAYCQVEKGLNTVNPKELGDAIDMIKDIEKTLYYHHVINAMKQEGLNNMKLTDGHLYYDPKDATKTLKDYLEVLTEEVINIIHRAGPEEKAILHEHMEKIMKEMN